MSLLREDEIKGTRKNEMREGSKLEGAGWNQDQHSSTIPKKYGAYILIPRSTPARVTMPLQYSLKQSWLLPLLVVALFGGCSVQAQGPSPIEVQLCGATMFAVDVDEDRQLNRAEYINLLVVISRYPGCIDVGQIGDFLGDAPLSISFENLACKCLDFESGPDASGCCTGRNAHLKVPGVYGGSYIPEVCTEILESLKSECTTQAPTVSAYPTLSPSVTPSGSPTTSFMPSTAPSSVPTVVTEANIILTTLQPTLPKVNNIPTANNALDDSTDILVIILPIILGILAIVLIVMLCAYRRHRKQHSDNAAVMGNPYDSGNQEYNSKNGAVKGTPQKNSRSIVNGNQEYNSFYDDDDNDPTTISALSESGPPLKAPPIKSMLKVAPTTSLTDEELGFGGSTSNSSLSSEERKEEESDESDDDEDADNHVTGEGDLGSTAGSAAVSAVSLASSEASESILSLGESMQRSYASAKRDGHKMTSRENAINSIIDQVKAGADWFEFQLPSDDEIESEDDSSGRSYSSSEVIDSEDWNTIASISKSLGV